MPNTDFTLEDFRRGVPALARHAAEADPERDLRAMDAIIKSMTPAERRECDRIEDSRCLRIASGSGARPEEVRKLLNDLRATREMIQKFPGTSMTNECGARTTTPIAQADSTALS